MKGTNDKKNKKTTKIGALLNKRKNAVGKYNPLFSMRAKVIALIFVGMVAAVAITSKVIVDYSKTLVVDSAYGKMLNIVTSYGTLVDKSEDGKALKTEEYEELLAEVTLDDISSAKCFLVSKSGIIAYHHDADMVGKPNKNKVITQVVADINKGKVPDNLCIEYDDEKGVKKYASFFITSAKSIIVMEADAAELTKPINTIVRRAVVYASFVIVIAMIIAFILASSMTRPLKEVTNIINDTAKLKLVAPKNLNTLCKRPDETGEISRAVKLMTDSLKDVVSKIDMANKSIEGDMKKLEASSNQVNEFCTVNSSTAEDLAASTREMADRIQTITDSIDSMRAKSEEIGNVTDESSEMSNEVAGRAQNMQATTRMAISKTRSMYQQLKEKTDAAVDGLKAVSKINELTEAISDISDQTSLLSLNASIEAARAGDAGRGFAVVAQEISKLADKSLENVQNIDLVIDEINLAVQNISKAMEDTSVFLEENVLADYDGFNEIGSQYLADADAFKNAMSKISNEIVDLNDAISKIITNLDDVQVTVSDTSDGVSNIAEKTSDVVQVTTDNYELTNNTALSVDDLKLIVDRFEL
ncbi:MAG: methyl-accepting chemotaxis protein [Lachnospiraceae bacterium]|nr:methyl-accepting chemotaxis protein [Lachnospiraceae bacterium]